MKEAVKARRKRVNEEWENNMGELQGKQDDVLDRGKSFRKNKKQWREYFKNLYIQSFFSLSYP